MTAVPPDPVTAAPSSLPSKLGPLPKGEPYGVPENLSIFGVSLPRVACLSGGTAAILLAFALFCLTTVSCSRPAVVETFVRADEAAGGIYSFDLALDDSLSVYDIFFYTAPVEEPLRLDVSWGTVPAVDESVFFPAGKSRAIYRSGVKPSGEESKRPVKLSVRVPGAPADFRGLGLICKRIRYGTR